MRVLRPTVDLLDAQVVPVDHAVPADIETNE